MAGWHRVNEVLLASLLEGLDRGVPIRFVDNRRICRSAEHRSAWVALVGFVPSNARRSILSTNWIGMDRGSPAIALLDATDYQRPVAAHCPRQLVYPASARETLLG